MRNDLRLKAFVTKKGPADNSRRRRHTRQLKAIPSKERVTAAALYALRARTLIIERLRAKQHNLKPRTLYDRGDAIAPASKESNDEGCILEINPPKKKARFENTVLIGWDLANPKNRFIMGSTEEEIGKIPFTPKQKEMTVRWCPDRDWTVPILAHNGDEFVTHSCFIGTMTVFLQSPVSLQTWSELERREKYEAACAYHRRTGELPAIKNPAVFAEWGKYIDSHADKPEFVEYIVHQMSRYVAKGAQDGMTRLQKSDLLCHSNIFMGLTYDKEAKHWQIHTRTPKIADSWWRRLQPVGATEECSASPPSAQNIPKLRLHQVMDYIRGTQIL